MRDLSQTQVAYWGQRSKGRLRLILILILISGGFYFVGNLFLGKSVGGSNVILREAPRGLVPVIVGESDINVEGGVQLTSQTAVMRDVKYGGEATATVKRSFGGGIYILTVDATLPDPKNVNYQVWLVGSGKTVSIDYMRGAKTSWSLSLRDSDKYSSYRGVWITLERSKDNIAEEHVMEGSF